MPPACRRCTLATAHPRCSTTRPGPASWRRGPGRCHDQRRSSPSAAHWQSAPLTLGATTPTPLVYDFYGFPERYYRVRYDSPGAPELAARIKALMPPGEPVAERPQRGLDHGAYVPLIPMYPEADIPVLQISMPDLAPAHLFELGRRLAPLRDEGVLIMGSGFMTHGLPFIHDYFDGRPGAPEWSVDSTSGPRDTPARRSRRPLRLPKSSSRDAITRTRRSSTSRRSSSPRRGDRPGRGADLTIDGYWLGLAKRSFQVR